MKIKQETAALYVHVPFCARKCLFCSFAIAVGQGHRTGDYIEALEKEAMRYRGMPITTVYFGGGTPSFLSEKELECLTAMVRRSFLCEPDTEWTMEANPESFDPSKAKFLKSLGINRLSLGVQSFNNRYLKFLGRNHDKDGALQAYDHARKAGFENVSLDLMFAFPGQTSDEITEDVQAMIALESEHISLYSLTIEENSRFFAKQLKLDDEERLAAHYVLISELLEKAGVRQYEISNFCREGRASQHNMNYWNGGSYIGLGVGAHGYLDHRRFWNVSKLPDYFSRVEAAGEAIEGFEELAPQTRLMERVLFGLRMNDGICIQDIEKSVGEKLTPERSQMVDDFVKDGFFVRDGARIRTSMKGRLVLDELSSRLI